MFNIAINTFKELTRNKVLYMILFFWVLLILFSLFLVTLSLGQTDKIILDFWLWMIEIFGLLSVIFIGSQMLLREVEGKTIYLILSKPIARYEFVIWKFLWFAMILWSMILMQSIIFLALIWYTKTKFDILIIFSILFIYLKLLVLFAIIFLLSTFISSMLSIWMTILIYVISHSVTEIIDSARHAKNTAMLILWKTLYVLFPNFEALNLKNAIQSPVPMPSGFIWMNATYAIIYLIITLWVTILIFNSKDFEN